MTVELERTGGVSGGDHKGNDGEEDPVFRQANEEAKAARIAAETRAPGVFIHALEGPAVMGQKLLDVLRGQPCCAVNIATRSPTFATFRRFTWLVPPLVKRGCG